MKQNENKSKQQTAFTAIQHVERGGSKDFFIYLFIYLFIYEGIHISSLQVEHFELKSYQNNSPIYLFIRLHQTVPQRNYPWIEMV